MKQIIMQNIGVEDLVSIIEAVVKPLLIDSDEQKQNSNPEVKLLTRKQTAEMLHVSLMTLYKWNKADVLKSYGVGNRVYYKLEDIEEALKRVA
jgi:excisionase family DNA binding protein